MATSMHELWARYKTYVKENPQSISQIEGVTRVLSYIIPAKLSSSTVLSELLYSASNLLVLLNDTILRDATRAYNQTPNKLNRLKSWLGIVECLEVFLEMGAETAGGPTLHWIIVVCIQIFKTAIRFLVLKACPRGLQTTPAIPAMNRKKELHEKEKIFDEVDKTSPNHGPSMTFTLERSGRTIRSIAAAPPMVQRTWKVPDKNSEMAPLPEEPTELDPRQQLAEGLYISRPLLHLLSMFVCGQRSWKPWLVASGVDLSSLYLMGDRKVFNSEERGELTRRTTMMLFYMLRSPFYDRFTKKRLVQFLRTLARTVPAVHLIIHPLIGYLPVWQRIYFYVWNQ